MVCAAGCPALALSHIDLIVEVEKMGWPFTVPGTSWTCNRISISERTPWALLTTRLDMLPIEAPNYSGVSRFCASTKSQSSFPFIILPTKIRSLRDWHRLHAPRHHKPTQKPCFCERDKPTGSHACAVVRPGLRRVALRLLCLGVEIDAFLSLRFRNWFRHIFPRHASHCSSPFRFVADPRATPAG